MTYALGLDFGTSGARAVVLDETGALCEMVRCNYPAGELTQGWQWALGNLLSQIPLSRRQQIQAIGVDGTSPTVLITNHQGQPIRPALLYNNTIARDQVPYLQQIVPPDHVVLSATSSLAKLLWYLEQEPLSEVSYFLHQTDWLSFLLHGQLGFSDEHNALKLGYDVTERRYPDWFSELRLPHDLQLPTVQIPGTVVAPVTPQICEQWGFSPTCQVIAGTTDSNAAFMASGASQAGEGVTSLGSTLVLKLLSENPVSSAPHGIYSHRLGEQWLVGGGSNTGGAVLRHFFSPEQLVVLSQQIDPTQPSPLEYYPLLSPGERFPINDPNFLPRLTPRPTENWQFLQGLLEGMARIECQGYQLLVRLGATPLRRVYSSGGGAANPVWTSIRARYLQVPLSTARALEAAYGVAQLAFTGTSHNGIT